MSWVIFIAGILIGAALHYFYDRFGGTVTARVQALETRLSELKARL